MKLKTLNQLYFLVLNIRTLVMITADEITPNSSAADLAAFLKFTLSGQFALLKKDQVDRLEVSINQAYKNHVNN